AAGCPDDALEQAQALHIEGIPDHASIARASNSDQPPRLSLRALGSDKDILWLINGRLVATTGPRQAFVHDYAEPGAKTITALGAAGGWAQIRIRVLP
ncbi:MAG: penicillin-binding protein 1C, partial [Rhodanobacteraceae bacterium]